MRVAEGGVVTPERGPEVLQRLSADLQAALTRAVAALGCSFQGDDQSEADEVRAILTGSFVRAIPVEAGDEIVCEVDHGLGRVDISFT